METISTLVLFVISNTVLIRAAVNVSISGEIPKLLNKYEVTLSKNKTALRYGFQHTNDCQDYEKAYLCITKCLDFKFDVAHADKNCKCVCYTHREKAHHTTPRAYNTTRWKLGAPTTSIPFWAQSSEEPEKKSPSNDIAIVTAAPDERIKSEFEADIAEEKLKSFKDKNPAGNSPDITHQNYNRSDFKPDLDEKKLKAHKKKEEKSSSIIVGIVTAIPGDVSTTSESKQDIAEQKLKTGDDQPP